MPFPTVKVLLEETKTALDAAVAAYLAGAGSAAATAIRAIELDVDRNDADNDPIWGMVIAHGGADVPAAAAKTADLQYPTVELDVETGDATDLAALQALVDAAIADAVHNAAVATDIDTTVAGTITSISTPFAAEDVGRKMRIVDNDETRTITAFTDSNNVDYDNVAEGALTSGTNLTVEFQKAEVLQFARLSIVRTPQNKTRVHLALALEGEAN